MNDFGQQGLGSEFGGQVPFFPHFRKLDYFRNNSLEVIQLSLGATTTHVLCRDQKTNKHRLFGFGSSEKGQLGTGQTLTKHEPTEITGFSAGEEKGITQLASGAFHSIILTSNQEIYGFGQSNKGQLAGGVSNISVKKYLEPVKIVDNTQLGEGKQIRDLYCGSLFSMATVYDTKISDSEA